MKYYLAIDIGASSGRHILGHVEDGRMCLEEVYRFENRQLEKDGHVCWDLENLKDGILGGLKQCAAISKVPETVGIDTWAVDFVLLDADGKMIGDAVAYRDGRTEGMDDVVSEVISPEELYARTGIQKQIFNTIYQFTALKKEHPEQLEQADAMLMLPDYFHYLLTGVKKQEYTNATSTGLVSAEGKAWDLEIIRRLGLPEKLFTELSMPGTEVGPFTEEIAREVGFSATVVLPATHDTGSAFLAVPARNETSVFLSSGTWSLLGVENERPITTAASQAQNMTNEGGAWYRYRYLKNIMGLWVIQSIRRELNGVSYIAGRESRHAGDREWGFGDLAEEARRCRDFPAIVNINDDRFLAPESMIDELCDAAGEAGYPIPSSVGEIMQCAYRSLTKSYAEAVKALQALTGKTYTDMNIVGGGCQDRYLNEMTAKAVGLPVHAGPVEGTAIGNLVVQMIAGGEFENLAEARECIYESFAIENYQP